MSHQRLPPPDPAHCLIPLARFKPKGGTLIAEDVLSLEEHRARLADGSSYRPSRCARCGHGVLHVHDYRCRVLLRAGSDAVDELVPVVRFVCVRRECGAIWQVLPAFIARHLWRTWRTIEAAMLGATPRRDAREIPSRTRSRWKERLASAALFVVQLFATQTGSPLETIATALGLEVTRGELTDAFVVRTSAPPGERLSRLAALLHRLHPRTRLM